LQDRAASDSLDPAITAMRLNMLIRRAVTLVRGIEIKQVLGLVHWSTAARGWSCSSGPGAVGFARWLPLLRSMDWCAVQDDQEFEMAVFSVVPWFKVIERYPLSGEERQFKRRDLRRGGPRRLRPRVSNHSYWQFSGCQQEFSRRSWQDGS
jgi:hypothetical protein